MLGQQGSTLSIARPGQVKLEVGQVNSGQGLTNRVSGRPGQPEKGAGQPGLGVFLPKGATKISYYIVPFLYIHTYTLQNVIISMINPGQPLFRPGN